MKTQLFIIVIGLLIAIQSPAKANPPLIILNDTNNEPFSTPNRDGFLDIVLEEVFNRIGYRLDTVHLPPERGLLSANSGIVDGEVNRINGLDKLYPNLVRVPEKIRDSEFCALSKNENIVNTPVGLSKYVIGHIKGWKVYDKMMANSDNVIMANSPKQLFRLLNIGRIDVALYACSEGLVLAEKLNIADIKILKPALAQTEFFIYLNKRHKHLLPMLTKALRDVKREGLYDRLYRQKILPYYKNTGIEF